jgi:2-iminobutanoate/2-iminopropanoate deaminase
MPSRYCPRARDDPCVHRRLSPASLAPPVANYALGVVADAPTRWLHTAGIVGSRPDGSVPDGIEAQAEVVWDSIGALLADAGMSAADVVSLTTYVVAGEPLGPVMAARDAFMGEHRAASTLVTVPALARAEWRMEVAVVAAV